jgi:hypothetical protein
MCGSLLTILAPGKRLRARASWALEWKPTTARVVVGRLVDPFGARIAAKTSPAESRAGSRGKVRA